NNMKKILLVISAMMVVLMMATGCSKPKGQTEEALIKRANTLIEQKYEVEINPEVYTYEVGEVLEKDQFVDIKEGEMPDIVFLRAVNKNKPSEGEVFDYSIQFNTATNEIITSEYEVYDNK
ncbi:MAG: hypothetical protein ACRCTE_01235, partial [Cellulosilyticaceae bacterium]